MDNTAIKIISYFDDIEEFLIGILFFTLPFGWTFSIIPLVLFATMLIINIITKPHKPSKEKVLYFLPLMAFYIWEAITLLYTSDMKNGIRILGTQSILIIIPLAFLFNNIRTSTIKKAFYMFLLGCLASVLLLYAIAIYHSSSLIGDAFVFRPFFESQKDTLIDSDISGYFFLGKQFSTFVHPAYMALLLGIGMFIILKELRIDSGLLINKTLWLVVFTVLGITIISMSLNGTSVMILVISLIVLGLLSIHRIRYGELSRGIYFSVLLFFMFLILNPQVKGIIENPNESNSLQLRSSITKASINTIEKSWVWGYGIGDANEAMNEQLIECCENDLACRKANSHNQFLTSWIQGGIPALTLLLWTLITISLRAQNKKVFLLHTFTALVFISFLFESMLVRYWGSLTFALFYGILYFYSKENKIDAKA